MRILAAIPEGQRDPALSGALVEPEVKATPEDVAESLEGDWRRTAVRTETARCLADSSPRQEGEKAWVSTGYPTDGVNLQGKVFGRARGLAHSGEKLAGFQSDS
jgi:hypothetical protein